MLAKPKSPTLKEVGALEMVCSTGARHWGNCELGIWPPLVLLHLMHGFISGSNKGELHGEFKSSIVFLQCCEVLGFDHQALEIIYAQ